MFDALGFETLTPGQAAIGLGLILGLAFGALAEITRFCLRRGLVAGPDRKQALATWLVALVAALIGTQIAVAYGVLDFADHRFHAPALPVLAITLGGLAFGAGMVLTRGCVSRLTVLSASGNLRAVTVLAMFALTAHATLKGILSPIRTTLGAVTIDAPTLPGAPWLWTGLIVLAVAVVVARAGVKPLTLGLAVALGLLVPAGWLGTGFVLFDDFDPIAFESLSFTAPWSETLFWTVASTAVPAGFGTGLIGGVLLGAFTLAILSGRFQWQSFETPRQTGRYIAGGALMGVGGVLAGGCTVGAGLSGVATLSTAAMLALVAIAAGARLMDRALSRALSAPSSFESGAPSATPQAQPAA